MAVDYDKTSIEEVSLLSFLSENYDSLYYVDFVANTIKPYRMNKMVESKFGDFLKKSPSYEEAMTAYVKGMVAPEDQEEMLKRSKPEYIQTKLENRSTYSYDFRVQREGKITFYRFKISNLDGISELRRAVVGFADVTFELDRTNQLIESQTMLKVLERDSLTGLYNKEFFFKRVKEEIENHPENRYILCTSDVQGLKVINEKYGMDIGDEILRKMAVNANTLPGYVFGGRIEGDKLSALALDPGEVFDINEQNAQLGDTSVFGFSIQNVVIKHGIYHINENDTLTIQGMYDRSLLALQSIKNDFDRFIAEYDDKLRRDLLINRQINECARDALSQHQFTVYYQPKIGVGDENIVGAEALVRWIHPEFGFMNPGVFVPLFEKNGFITSLDFYIWEEVCKAIYEWNLKGLPKIQISVNVSRRDFEDLELAEKIVALVDNYGIDHSQFQIEITESSYSDNPEVIKSTIKKLHDSGFSIALDDFGTGYSSMIALSSLDLDVMKLDMSIIQNDKPEEEKNVLEFSMQLAKMMKLKTVAEGVETQAQVQRIDSLGGDYIQGYFYSKPLPKDQFEDYIKNY